MAPLKALIIGGGVTGPAHAYWLSRAGVDITMIERAPNLRTTGQQVDLRGQGVSMMRMMGMEPAVKKVRVHEKGTQAIDRQGQVKAFFPAGESGGAKQSLTSEFEIMRGDLVRILVGLTKDNPKVKCRFQTTVTAFTEDDESDPNGKVHVTFNDGTTEDFDFIVAADGSGSKTRKLMLGPDTPDPRRSLGSYVGFFSVPSDPEDPDRFTFCHLPKSRNARIIATRKDCKELTRVYMLVHGESPAIEKAYRAGDLEGLKQVWADEFKDGGWKCDRFVHALLNSPEADDLYCTPFEEVQLPVGSWSKGRVILAGDAAHSQTANGWGCSWGMVGAYILAGEIMTLYDKDPSSPSQAIIQGAKNYESTFRPIACAGHDSGTRMRSLMFPESRLGIWFLHSALYLLSLVPLDKMPNIDSKTSKWKLPVYPALKQDVIAA